MIAFAAAWLLGASPVAGTDTRAAFKAAASDTAGNAVLEASDRADEETGASQGRREAPGVADPMVLHRHAARRLTIIVEEAFAEIRRALTAEEAITEAAVVAFIEQRFARDGLVAGHPPRVAAAAHGSYPDHAGGTSSPIRRGDVVVVELMARRNSPGAVHARTSWTAFAGTKEEIPQRVARVWQIVKDAREAALGLVRERIDAGATVTGAEVDAAARSAIRRAKHGSWFLHPAGRALGPTPAAEGPSLAAGETRALAAGRCFALHPAIYYPGEFGMRTEVSFCVTRQGAPEVTTGVRQVEIRPLLE